LARYAALGDISGDWGGGSWLGLAAHRAAIRARDGRGPRTELERAVPAHFGLSSPRAVMEAIYLGRLDPALLTELPPVVFDVAQRGDAVGRALIDQLAGEVVAMAGAAIRKLRLTRLDVEVVLGGGVFRNRDAQFLEAIEAGITAVAPAARITVLQAPPVVGSALMGLDRLAASNGALERVRRTLTHERFGGRDQVGADRA
ncbi:MAG: BadF/BadG/BcrA/BcrD ATPase family protein, partial [Gaiellales bacterium]